MDFITGKHISRREALRGMGATVALPFLDAMVPAGRRGAAAATLATDQTRLVAIEMVHGAAGSNTYGASKNLWAPATVGRDFDLTPGALSSLEPFRDYLTIISNTDVQGAEAVTAPEIGGDHFRSSAVFLTQSHPKQTEGSDVFVGTSLDQYYAQRFGQDTPIPSMQLCIENINQSGGCAYGYTCVYTDSISWASPTEPLPVIRDPRVAFEQLFGAGGTAEERALRRQADRSILDWITGRVGELQRELGPTDRQRLEKYLDDIRETERRIELIEEYNASGELREMPEAPAGVPDSFEEHVKLMFDLQVLAFESDLTRVFSFKMGRDSSARAPDNSQAMAATGFLGAGLSGEWRRQAVPPRLAPRWAGRGDRRFRAHQSVPREHDPVLPRQAEEHDGRRGQLAGQVDDHLWLADGRSQPPQSQALPAVRGGWCQRQAAGQPALQGAGRYAHGERDARLDAQAGAGRHA